MESEIVISGDQKVRLESFFAYLDDHAAIGSSEGRKPRKSQAIGVWWPIWEIDVARGSLIKMGLMSEEKDSMKKALFEALLYAHEKTDKETPIFLDLGSGDGVACFEAAIAGYKTIGVELDSVVYQRALNYQKDLEEQGIINRGKTHFKEGVYYLEKYWNNICSNWEKRKPELEDRIHDLGVRDYSEDLERMRQQYESKLAELSKGTGTLEEFLDSAGKLNVDVIFWYPSDSMAESSKEQWIDILKSDTLFIVSKHSSQTMSLQESGFFDEDNYRLLKEDLDFLVYQRK